MAETSIRVRLTPRSGKTEIQRYEDGVLHARVAAPPVDGAANTALVALLSSTLGIPKSSIRIVSGASSREKKVAVMGSDLNEVEAALHKFAVGRTEDLS